MNQNTGWAYNCSGSYNTILKTTDEGKNWSIISGNNVFLNKIFFINENTGWDIYDKTIYKTTDGGFNWFIQWHDLINFCSFTNIGFFNDTGIAIDSYGKILKTTNDGGKVTGILQQFSNVEPFQNVILHNYPNPFNPSTKIQFGIQNNSHVAINIYNTAGIKITTLINENLSTGVYEVTWNAANYSSGVYFYTFEINGRRLDTKKLVLCK